MKKILILMIVIGVLEIGFVVYRSVTKPFGRHAGGTAGNRESEAAVSGVGLPL
jgi:hypothetical protein